MSVYPRQLYMWGRRVCRKDLQIRQEFRQPRHQIYTVVDLWEADLYTSKGEVNNPTAIPISSQPPRTPQQAPQLLSPSQHASPHQPSPPPQPASTLQQPASTHVIPPQPTPPLPTEPSSSLPQRLLAPDPNTIPTWQNGWEIADFCKGDKLLVKFEDDVWVLGEIVQGMVSDKVRVKYHIAGGGYSYINEEMTYIMKDSYGHGKNWVFMVNGRVSREVSSETTKRAPKRRKMFDA